MNSTIVRRVTLSAVLVTALAAMAACGSGGSDEGGKATGRSTAHTDPLTELRSAEKTTAEAESAKVRSTTALGSVMSMTADGTLGWRDGITGTLTITYTGGTVADAMRKLGSTTMETRYLPDAYYARMGDAFARQAGGRHWVKYGYDALADLAGASGAHLKDQTRNATPNQSVKLLLASGDVRKVGAEKVSGENAARYSGTVDVADLATRNSGLTASGLADLKKQLDQAGVTTETIDIWVDDQGLLLKKVDRGTTANGTMTSTAYYSDYGARLSVQKPPASDTQDFTSLMHTQGATGLSG
ncbi:hypothetical protein ACFC09_27885 [Streptomyces sp. NPDC056161]|uniref:hypothetical protein n=1 Tax=Streptomyces sp. NPDC056161 TaxID=3345732 RepID=UPI0035DB8DE4